MNEIARLELALTDASNALDDAHDLGLLKPRDHEELDRLIDTALARVQAIDRYNVIDPRD